MHDGLSDAYYALTRELQAAVSMVVIVPFDEYEKRGGRAGIRSALGAVPGALLRLMIGATDIDREVRNSLDAELN